MNTNEEDGESSVASRSEILEVVPLLPVSDNEPNEKLFVLDVNDDDWGAVVVLSVVVVVAAAVPKENVLVNVDCSFSVDDPGMRLGEAMLLDSLSPPDTSWKGDEAVVDGLEGAFDLSLEGSGVIAGDSLVSSSFLLSFPLESSLYIKHINK